MDHEAVQAFCAGLPGATVDVKWQVDLVYSVGGKMFCVMCSNLAQSTGLSLKVDPERFLELTDQPGITPAPYLARHHWVRLDHPGVLPEARLTELLHQSYSLVRAKLPKKQRDALPSLNPFPGSTA
ncbi:MmcQ/YjbR family DNA-binding protein [Chitinimonas naiadis]